MTELIFIGLKYHPRLQVFLFLLFLLFYLVTVTGNLGMMFLIRLDSLLPHTDVRLSQFTCPLWTPALGSGGPQVLADFFAERKAISLPGLCLAAVVLWGSLWPSSAFSLASMAYDRYVAIVTRCCVPLPFPEALHPAGGGDPTLRVSEHHDSHNSCFSSPFVAPRNQSFLLYLSPLLSRVCADTWINKLLFSCAGAVLVVSSLTIVISYFYILLPS
nr:olfactory receptor 1009-like [Camelus dromedarius]